MKALMAFNTHFFQCQQCQGHFAKVKVALIQLHEAHSNPEHFVQSSMCTL
jgi:hypothetical protein